METDPADAVASPSASAADAGGADADADADDPVGTSAAGDAAAVIAARAEAKNAKILAELADDSDPRRHANVVFIGHVDAGKSTISGNVLVCTGQVDQRTIQRYEKEAKELNRESWYLAFIMDTNEEERAKGKTVEVGRAEFETTARRFTVLDAPGHANYVPDMINGAAQADIGVLVISARRGEFEAGFERQGQTREHALLAKTLGIKKLVVAVNKMDDPTMLSEDGKWNQERYDAIVGKLKPFLRKSCGYAILKDCYFLPMSGLNGANLLQRVSKDMCNWYDGPSLLELLDTIPLGTGAPDGPLRVPVRAWVRACMHAFACVRSHNCDSRGRLEVALRARALPFEIQHKVSLRYPECSVQRAASLSAPALVRLIFFRCVCLCVRECA